MRSWTTSSPSARRTSADRSTPARTRSRSTSPRAGSRASSIRRAGCSATSSRSTTGCSTASRTRSGPGSACTRARAGTWTRRTAPTSTTPSCCPTCSSSTSATCTSRWRASRTRAGVLDIIAEHLRPDQRIFVGVTDPIDPAVESPEQVRDRVLEAADRLPQDRLGTTDDCGFSPFGDDTRRRATSRSRRSARGSRGRSSPRSARTLGGSPALTSRSARRAGVSRFAPASSSHPNTSFRIPSAVTPITSPRWERPEHAAQPRELVRVGVHLGRRRRPARPR